MSRRSALALVALPVLLLAAPAGAAPRSGRGGRTFSLWAVLDPGPVDGLGAGGRLMVPIVPEGVLRSPSVRDEITLEVGADFLHYSDAIGVPPFDVDYSWNGFLLVAGGTWNFWLTPAFALYPKLDLGLTFGWYSNLGPFGRSDAADLDGVFIQGALGLIYRLQTVSLRLELGSGLLRIGVGFAL